MGGTGRGHTRIFNFFKFDQLDPFFIPPFFCCFVVAVVLNGYQLFIYLKLASCYIYFYLLCTTSLCSLNICIFVIAGFPFCLYYISMLKTPVFPLVLCYSTPPNLTQKPPPPTQTSVSPQHRATVWHRAINTSAHRHTQTHTHIL